MDAFLPWFFLLGGLFTVVSAGGDFAFFMEHPKARAFAKVFGRTGTRIFYVLIGLALMGFGGGVLLGVIDAG